MRIGQFISAIAILLSAGSPFAPADAQTVVNPSAPGAYAVGCSNVAQNFLLAPSDNDRDLYWSGYSPTQYVTQLLSEPQGTFTYTSQVPNDSGIFTNYAGQTVSYIALVCYPTSAENSRPDYAIDAALTRFVPKMQRGGELPLFADPAALYPVLVFAHGLNGSPLDDDYLQAITLLASHGYVVMAPFFGDGRFGYLSLDSWSDLTQLLSKRGYWQAVELQAVRPLSLHAALDKLLSDPGYRDHVDADHIAGFGISLGGESLLLFSGAQLTTHFAPRLASSQIISDRRLKAIAGYIPYFGQHWLPAFGDSQVGVDGMTVPFLGIAGTADNIARIDMIEQGANRMAGPRYVVAIDGLGHAMPVQDFPDIFTWTLTFLDAYLHNDVNARAQMAQMHAVSGGAADSIQIAYTPSNYITTLSPGWNLLGNGFDANLEAANILGDASKVSSVWTWSNTTNNWAFYSPALSSQALSDYAAGRGFRVLSTIQGGEGFWVNAKQAFDLTLPGGIPLSAANSHPAAGWNLVAIGETKTPGQYNTAQASDITSLWAWNSNQGNWYFYAPSLSTPGNTALTDYITQRGYLDFTTNGKTLGQSMGFWVSKP